jgi:ketosteroid isomerase-like protein
MSQENVEQFRRAVDAYSRGDVEAFVATAHPEVEWIPFTAQAEGGEAYRGHNGVRRWWSNMEGTFDEFEASVDECRDLGGTVIAFGRLRLRAKSGVSLEQEIAWVSR